MTSTSAEPAGPSNTNPVQRSRAGTGQFMLTLCRLAAPVSIRPPQSPHLRPFTFFTSRAHQADGSIAIEVRTVGGAAPVGAKAFGQR